jgi:hypothetical protein
MDYHRRVYIVLDPGFVSIHGINIVGRIFMNGDDSLKIAYSSVDLLMEILRITTVFGDIDVILSPQKGSVLMSAVYLYNLLARCVEVSE